MRDIARLDDYRATESPQSTADVGIGPTDPPAASPADRGAASSADGGAPRAAGAPPSAEWPRTESTTTPRGAAPGPEPLWREALGERLRARRREHGATLTRTAERAGISPQYLSEMERGLKEPSSEMIAAVAGALGTSLPDLVRDVARHLTPAPGRASDPPAPQLSAAAV